MRGSRPNTILKLAGELRSIGKQRFKVCCTNARRTVFNVSETPTTTTEVVENVVDCNANVYSGKCLLLCRNSVGILLKTFLL